jgi:uncharacterized integral membrane protein
MLALIVLSVLLLAVLIFTLQNAQAVTVRFLFWELQSSVAVVALAATAAGVLIAGLFGLASRLLRWKRNRPVTGPARPAVPPLSPATPPRSTHSASQEEGPRSKRHAG